MYWFFSEPLCPDVGTDLWFFFPCCYAVGSRKCQGVGCSFLISSGKSRFTLADSSVPPEHEACARQQRIVSLSKFSNSRNWTSSGYWLKSACKVQLAGKTLNCELMLWDVFAWFKSIFGYVVRAVGSVMIDPSVYKEHGTWSTLWWWLRRVAQPFTDSWSLKREITTK